MQTINLKVPKPEDQLPKTGRTPFQAPPTTPQTVTVGPDGKKKQGHGLLQENGGSSYYPPRTPGKMVDGTPQQFPGRAPGVMVDGNPQTFSSGPGLAAPESVAPVETQKMAGAELSGQSMGQKSGLLGQAGTDFSKYITDGMSVESRLDNILKSASPLMQRAEQQGLQAANRRGLLNSSIAAGASQGAMMDRALPIAQQDAQMEAQFGQAGQQYDYQRGLSDQQFRQTWDLAGQDFDFQKYLQDDEQKYDWESAGRDFDFNRFLQDDAQKFQFDFLRDQAKIDIEKREDEQAYEQAQKILSGNIDAGLKELDASLLQQRDERLRRFQVGDRDFEANRDALNKYVEYYDTAMKELREIITQISTSPDLNDQAKSFLIEQYIADTNYALDLRGSLLEEFGLTPPQTKGEYGDFDFAGPWGPEVVPGKAPEPELDDTPTDVGGIDDLLPDRPGPGVPPGGTPGGTPTNPGAPGTPGGTPNTPIDNQPTLPPGDDGVGYGPGNRVPNPNYQPGPPPPVGTTNARGDQFYGEGMGWLGNYKGARVVDTSTGIAYERQPDGSIVERRLQPGDVVWSSGMDAHIYVRDDGRIDVRPFQYA